VRLANLAWRSLAARPLRSALSVIGVALGVAVVAATMITAEASDAAVRSAAAELYGRADVRLRAFADAGFTPRTVQNLRALPEVSAGAPVAERRLVVGVEPDRVFNLLVLGIDPEAEPAIRDPNLVDGVALSSDSPTDALVPADWAAANGLGLGDRLVLAGARPTVPALRIVGLLDQVGFGALERGEVLVTARDTLDDAFEVPAPIRYIDLALADDVPNEDALAAVDAAIGEPYILETEADAASRLGAAQANFAAVAFLFGILALVVGAFLVGNTLAMTVGERTREIGLLRAAGTTARQVTGLVVRQGLALGLGGATLGLLLGFAMAGAMLAFLRVTRTALVEGLPLPPLGLLLAATLGLLVALVATAVPAVRAAGLSPLDALRPSRAPDRGLGTRLRWLVVTELLVVALGLLILPLERGDAPIVPLVLSLALLVGGAVATSLVLAPLGALVGRPFEWFFGAQGRLGRGNLARDRTRTGLTVGALMIGLAAVVAFGTVAESARAAADRWVASVLPGGHAVRLPAPIEVATFRSTIEATPGLEAASPILQSPAIWQRDEIRREVSLAGIEPSVFQDAGSLIVSGASRSAAFNALRAGGAVLVPRVMAERDGIAVGDTLSLGAPSGEQRSFGVAGILDYTIPARSPDGALIVNATDLAEPMGISAASLWAMIPRPNVAPSSFAAAVRTTAMDLGGEAVSADDLADELSRSLDRLVALFDALALVAVVIGALGIVNTLAMGVSERVREIAILRSHGMTGGQVEAMVVTEAAIMGVIGGVMAIATGLAVAWALVSADTVGFGAGLRLPWPLLVAIVLVGTGVATAAGLYPARLAARLPIVPHLKQFE
jgi:putative ABC transport system permease protein